MKRRSFAYVMIPAALAASSLTGCGLEPGTEDDVDVSDSDLFAPHETRVRFWTGGVVNICSHRQPQIATVGQQMDLPRARGLVADALNSSWAAAAKIRFDWNCRGTDKVYLRLHAGYSFGAIGGAAGLGAMPDNTVNITYCSPNSSGSNCGGDHEEQFRSVVIHEFGHVLGFLHEHQRPDTPLHVQSWCDDAKVAARRDNPDNNGFVGAGRYLSRTYDHGSIMNYCRDQDGNRQVDKPWDSIVDRLSPADRMGAAAVYGAR